LKLKLRRVAGQVVIGHGQLGILRADRLHDPVQVLGIFLADAGRGEARGRAHEVIAGRRRKLHHVVAGLVEQLLEKLVQAAGVGRTGPRDEEDQRRRMILLGQAIAQLLDRPEVVRQRLLALGAQVQGMVGLIDVAIGRQRGPQIRRRGGNGGLERIVQRVAIGGGIDILRQRRRTHQEAAQQGSEAQ
jgi:hypothetical protein